MKKYFATRINQLAILITHVGLNDNMLIELELQYKKNKTYHDLFPILEETSDLTGANKVNVVAEKIKSIFEEIQ